jgi:phosphate-selective porin OprO/OprP
MSMVRARCSPCVLALVLGLAVPCWAPSAAAEEPEAPPLPDVETRVRDLEKTVEALKAAQRKPKLVQAQVQASEDGTDETGSPAPSPEATGSPGPNPEGTGSPAANPEVPDGRGQRSGSRSDSGGSQGGGRGVSLERERVGADPGSSPSGGLPKGQVAGWNNGFYVQSPDQRFVFRITGQIQADYKAFVDDHDTTDVDTFLVRRARLGLEATLYDYYEFRLLPDFGLGRLVLQDAYMNVHYFDAFQFEAGKFKQPFSYEQLIQDRYVPTLERSLIDQLVPARDVGFMVHGQKLFDHHFDYYFAYSNGIINGDQDVNNSKDFNGRIVLHPFGAADEGSPLRFLSFGVSGGFGLQNEPIQPNTLVTPLGVKWLTFNPTVQAYGERSRWSPEGNYFYGPFGVSAQYFHMDQEMIAAPTGKPANHRLPVAVNGYYVLTTLLLTGERRTDYSQAIDPVRPFDLRHPIANPGAIELVARVSFLHVDGDVFTPGPFQLANPSNSAGVCTESTLGFNWYLNRQMRMQFNWEHAHFDRGVLLGPGPNGHLGHQDTLGTRFQIIF